MRSKQNNMADFTKRLKETAKKVTCRICEGRDETWKCICCCECGGAFHKTCVQPLRAYWPEDEEFICDECCESCIVCGGESETTDNPIIICSNCDEYFHVMCLEDEDDRPPAEEIGDEETEWYCPACMDEYASDQEWADEHVVDEQDMTADECFARSSCSCATCVEMNRAHDTWSEWQPESASGVALKQAIDDKQGLVNTVMDNLHMQHGKPPPK